VPDAPKQITVGCRDCQSQVRMTLSKSGYYEGVCQCGARWQTPKQAKNNVIVGFKPLKEEIK